MELLVKINPKLNIQPFKKLGFIFTDDYQLLTDNPENGQAVNLATLSKIRRDSRLIKSLPA